MDAVAFITGVDKWVLPLSTRLPVTRSARASVELPLHTNIYLTLTAISNTLLLSSATTADPQDRPTFQTVPEPG